MAKDYKDQLVVKISRLPEAGLDIALDLPREWLDNIPEFSDDSGPHIQGTIRAEGRLVREGQNLRLRGRVSAALVTICVRCGQEITCPLASDFEIVLLPGREADLPQELELNPEDLSQTYYQGEDLDLNPFFQEQVALEVPLQPLCKPDCAGLCPTCGADRNREECSCVREEGDPRLAAIRNLKLDK